MAYSRPVFPYHTPPSIAIYIPAFCFSLSETVDKIHNFIYITNFSIWPVPSLYPARLALFSFTTTSQQRNYLFCAPLTLVSQIYSNPGPRNPPLLPFYAYEKPNQSQKNCFQCQLPSYPNEEKLNKKFMQQKLNGKKTRKMRKSMIQKTN